MEGELLLWDKELYWELSLLQEFRRSIWSAWSYIEESYRLRKGWKLLSKMVGGGWKQVLHSSVIRVQLNCCIFCQFHVPRQKSWTASWHLQREPSALTVLPSKYLTFLGPWCPTNMDCVIAHWLALHGALSIGREEVGSQWTSNDPMREIFSTAIVTEKGCACCSSSLWTAAGSGCKHLFLYSTSSERSKWLSENPSSFAPRLCFGHDLIRF